MSNQPKAIPATRYSLRRAHCAAHGLQPFYTACSCVVKFGTPAAHVLKPSKSKTGMGEILCHRTNHEMHEMVQVCVFCANENGWSKVPAQ